MMDFLECKICNIPYDEEERRPRNAPCGHEWCSACINDLIQDSIFLCPKCRQKCNIEASDDLPITFGLVDAIRAFKSLNICLPQKTEHMTSEALKVDGCKVHQKTIEYRCLKCHRWLCDICLCSHTKVTGCSTISSVTAIKNLKDGQIKVIDELVSNFKDGSNCLLSRIQEHNNKIEEIDLKMKQLKQQSEEHGKEIKKIEQLLEQGKQQIEDIMKSKEHLTVSDSPYAVMDRIEVIEEMQLALRRWSITHIQKDIWHDNSPCDISKILKHNKNTYVEMVINDQRRQGKLSQYEDNIYFHCFQAPSVTQISVCIPFANLQKLIPPSPTLVFMEISMRGVVKGHVHLRLKKELPNIREHMVQLVTGQQGHTFIGIALDKKSDYSIANKDLPFKDMKITTDSNPLCSLKRGDVTAYSTYYQKGHLETITFYIKPMSNILNRVIGFIESGMDILQDCYDNHSQDVVITDCGLVLEQK